MRRIEERDCNQHTTCLDCLTEWPAHRGHRQVSFRLWHSPSLVAVGLLLEYETWPLIGWHHPFVIGWSKYRLREASSAGHSWYAAVHCGLVWLVGFPNFVIVGICICLPFCVSVVPFLTHWGRDKMDAISQATFSQAFSSMKIAVFWLNFHWNMFARVQLTIIQHWYR